MYARNGRLSLKNHDALISPPPVSSNSSLSSDIEMPVKIVYLMDLLGEHFPQLEGDQVTFIGSTFVNYGEE
ncbi:MAG: hypothetical protein WCK34_14745 [Bacteroidota bacterium]